MDILYVQRLVEREAGADIEVVAGRRGGEVLESRRRHLRFVEARRRLHTGTQHIVMTRTW